MTVYSKSLKGGIDLYSGREITGEEFYVFSKVLRILLDSSQFLTDLYSYRYPNHKVYFRNISDVDENNKTITIQVEYNDSCNCHPEYCIDDFVIPFAWLVDPKLAKIEIDRLLEKEKQEREKREAEDKEALKKKARERDYNQYLKLKERFDGKDYGEEDKEG